MAEGINISDYVYEKKFHCPVCDIQFMSPIARFGKSRVISTDSDLKTNYSPFNPMPYEVIVCANCGYAESVDSFPNPLPERVVERLIEEIRPKYWGHTYPPELTTDMALERVGIVLACNEAKNGKLSARAHIYLKMAWVCREAGDAREQEYLAKALDGFKQAYQAEKPPIAGMDESAISYLIGELERRVGNEDEALRWFGKVVTARGVGERIKDRAMDQKEAILAKRRADANPEPTTEKAKSEEKQKKKFLWF